MYRAILFAAVAAAPTLAVAHATFETPKAVIGKSYKAVLRVPHGCDGAPTLRVRVTVPEGIHSVKPMPHAGWTLDTVRGPYAGMYGNHGANVTEGVKEIVWSGRLPDDQYDEFVFTGTIGPDFKPGTKLAVPVTQDCETSRVAWTEIAAPGADAHALKYPAPTITLVAEQAAVPAGPIAIQKPWIRATAPGAPVAGGFMVVTNSGKDADTLIGGTFEAAGRVEVHEMAMDGEVMKMRPLVNGLAVPAGGSVELKPGGFHIMFMDLKQPLKEGTTVKGTLQFKTAGAVPVEYKIESLGAKGPGMDHSAH